MRGRPARRELAASLARVAAETGRPGTLRIDVDDDEVVISDREHVVRTSVDGLCGWVRTRTRAADPGGVDAAVRLWVDLRPVCDADAAAHGIATLGWSAAGDPAWQVVVERPAATAAWQRGPALPAHDAAAVQAAAFDRASRVVTRMWTDGDVAMWRCEDRPSLTGAVLANPPRMLAQMNELGLPTTDRHAVISPPGTLACAGRMAAARLAAEIPARHVVRALNDLDTIGWL